MIFLAYCYENHSSISYFSKIIPSLLILEKIIKPGESALTIRVQAMVKSFKRHLCQRRQHVKKGTPFPIDIFWTMAKRRFILMCWSCIRLIQTIFVLSFELFLFTSRSADLRMFAFSRIEISSIMDNSLKLCLKNPKTISIMRVLLT